ncbi:MAG TPA: multicopper oxidase domain-containing protein [Herpetosiphonaceae bacterium]
MVSRRRFLKLGAAVGAGLLMPRAWYASQLAAATPHVPGLFPMLDPTTLTKYLDPLPLPGVLQPVGKAKGGSYYIVQMNQAIQQLHAQLAPTTVWGYNGLYPGPTLEARTNQPVTVKWINNLPAAHLLPVDTTLGGTNMGEPAVRTVVHLHGGHVPQAVDGYPEDAFVPGGSATYIYPNAQHASTLWYHDHALGITRLNVYAGLAGFWLLRDAVEDSLNLPRRAYEIPIVIQDRAFNADGSLFYPTGPDEHVESALPMPSIVPEFFGDTILVNGKVWPFLEVEPRRYRFRILNGSNSRFYNLALGGVTFRQIGSEGGLLPAPVDLTEILLAPGERADVLVDFAAYTGQTLLMTNSASDGPFTGLGNDPPAEPATTGQIMQFRVTRPLQGSDTSSWPTTLPPFQYLSEASAVQERFLTLNEGEDDYGRLMLLIDNKGWHEVSEYPVLGTTEIWSFANVTPDTHPIHLHLVQFQILDRQQFNLKHYEKTGKVVFIGPRMPPDANERGWKDTARMNPGEVTRIIMRFEDYTGFYPYHCHILEHEDHEMMRQFQVVAGM